jgi:hypothetical protein
MTVMTTTLPSLSRTGLSRRGLAGVLAAPVLLGARAQGQTPVAASGDAAAAAARGQFQIVARQLAGVKLPRNVEPAFHFEA